MNNIQIMFDQLIFADSFPPRLLPRSNNGANVVEKEFWDSRYNMNLDIANVEIEVRAGRCSDRRFCPGVTRELYHTLCAGFQKYSGWDAVDNHRSTSISFDKVDGSIRCVVEEDGTARYVSKQKICVQDFESPGCFTDFRVCASVEVPVSQRPPLSQSTRTVTRDRQSFTLSPWRYDLTVVTDVDGHEEYHVEIELENIDQIQKNSSNSQIITESLRLNIINMIRIVQTDFDTLQLNLKNKRWF